MRTVARINASGFSLIETLIAMGVGLMLFSSASYLLHSQVSTVRSLKIKLELLSLHIDIQRAFSSGSVCLRNFSSVTINESRIGQPDYFISLPELVDDGTPPIRMLTAGQLLSELTIGVIPENIRVTNIEKLADNSFMADITAPLLDANDKNVYTINLSRIRLMTSGASPASAKVPVSCRYGSGGGSGIGTGVDFGSCRLAMATGTSNLPFNTMCAANEVAVAGGGRCLNGAGMDWDEPAIPPAQQVGYLYQTHQVNSGGLSGWMYDCYNPHVMGDFSVNQNVVYCCRSTL